MYTRFYTQVLARSEQYHSAQALLHAYEDNGIFALSGSAPAQVVPQLATELTKQLRSLTQFYVSDAELSRAKNMLKAMLMMNLEHRSVELEDVARQLLTFGRREDPADTVRRIDAVTAHDLALLAVEMAQSPLSLAVLGDVPGMQTAEQLRSLVLTGRF